MHVRSLISRACLSLRIKLLILLVRENNSGKQLYSTIWNMKNSNNRPVASGLYLIRAETDNYAAVGKMIIIK